METACASLGNWLPHKVFDYLATDKREANGGLWERVSANEHPQYHFEKITPMMMNVTNRSRIAGLHDNQRHRSLVAKVGVPALFSYIGAIPEGPRKAFSMNL